MSSSSAPGRVNLLGEHTDYNGGWVLPVAIPQRTWVEVKLRPDRLAHLWSASTGLSEYVVGQEKPRGDWSDYVQGVTWALREKGIDVPGFDVKIRSDVPVGSGLSSSAALELALLRALRAELKLALDDVELALLGRKAENGFVGAPVGVMDQMASSLASTNEALFLDTLSMAFTRVPIPPKAQLLVVDSGVAHQHATGDYKTRKAECDEAARLLGVASLREVQSLETLKMLPAPLDRRARHVLTENARVHAGVQAMKSGDLEKLGALFDESHASQRDDYECSVPKVDALQAALRKERGVLGARLTGGGFGGSVVALVGPAGDAAEIGAKVTQQLGGRVLVPEVRK